MPTRRTRPTLPALALLTAIVACADPTGVEPDGVLLNATPAGIDVRNHRTAPIYTFASDRATAALINWTACVDPAACDGIEPGGTRTLPASAIAGWGESAEVIVYWWHLVPGEAGGFQPDSIRWVIVPSH